MVWHDYWVLNSPVPQAVGRSQPAFALGEAVPLGSLGGLSLSLSSPLPGMDEDEVTAAVPDGIPPCQETKMHPAWKR